MRFLGQMAGRNRREQIRRIYDHQKSVPRRGKSTVMVWSCNEDGQKDAKAWKQAQTDREENQDWNGSSTLTSWQIEG